MAAQTFPYVECDPCIKGVRELALLNCSRHILAGLGLWQTRSPKIDFHNSLGWCIK